MDVPIASPVKKIKLTRTIEICLFIVLILPDYRLASAAKWPRSGHLIQLHAFVVTKFSPEQLLSQLTQVLHGDGHDFITF